MIIFPDEGGGLFSSLLAAAAGEEVSGVLVVPLPVRNLAGVSSLFTAPLAAVSKAQVNNFCLEIAGLSQSLNS